MFDQQNQNNELLVLIDGNAILHRAYHALPALTTRSGELVNAVYGFASMLLRILEELKPKYIAVSFDTAKANFRHAEYLGYKANRPRMDSELVGQIELVHELVRTFNVPIFEVDGYEADDVIGTLARQATEVQSSKCKVQSLETLIVTGDKDLMQLVNDKVKLYMPTKGLSEAKIVGREDVFEKMGVYPERIPDYKGLVGDPSDNYPGVPGIGPKTAVELLKKFESVEEIYRRIGEVGGIRDVGGENTLKKLAEGAESAVMSKKLATVLYDVPIKLDLEKCVSADYDKEKALAFFKNLGFRSLIGRVLGEKREETVKKEKKDERQQALF